MKFLAAALILPFLVTAVPHAHAQATERKTSVPNRQDQNGTFGTGWAKPGGTTGSYIANDPRQPDPNRARSIQRGKGCAAPLMYDVASGTCR